MKLIIFGIGRFYERRKERLFESLGSNQIVAFIDNKIEEDTVFESNYMLCNPKKVKILEYDQIILMSYSFYEMKQQLMEYGVGPDKIILWEQYYGEKLQGHMKFFTSNSNKETCKKKILIVTHTLEYGGGSVAAAYASMALQQRGYTIWIATPVIDRQYVNELVDNGCNIAYIPCLPYMGEKEKTFISYFDMVLVNVFPMIKCACDIVKMKPTLWWIHENSNDYDTAYEIGQKKFPDYDNLDSMKKIHISAVSGIARDNFEIYYPKRIDSILPFGIPDEYNEDFSVKEHSNKKYVFAIIGPICERKGQIVLARALELFTDQERDQMECWLIGESNTGLYSDEVKRMTVQFPEIRIMGKMTRQELKQAFTHIDSVICTSLEETMSIAVVEGMMFEKLCITTNKTGIAEFIQNGENGFICEAGNVKALANTIRYILQNSEKLNSVKEKARETYEKYFTLDRFGERLEQELIDTENHYK